MQSFGALFLYRFFLGWTMPCNLQLPQCTYTLISIYFVPMLSLWSYSLFATLWSLPSSFVHGILQARILEWVAMPSPRGSAWPRDRTHVSSISCTAGTFFSYMLSSGILLCSTWDICLCTIIHNMSLGNFISHITHFLTLGITIQCH